MRTSSEYGCYAYFKVTSKQPLAQIAEHFGVEGEDRSWSIGDIRERVPSTQYDFSNWKMSSGLKVGMPLDSHLKALWTKMEVIRSAVCEIPDEMFGLIQCVGHFKGNREPFTLSAGHFSTAAYYRLQIDFDFYFDNNFGHEDLGKPYWDWN